MFVRIKKRRLTTKLGAMEDSTLHVMIVESYRKEGKPRQRVLNYLGSIRESQFRNPDRRRLFVRQMVERLEVLPYNFDEILKLRVAIARLRVRTSGRRN